MKDLFIKTIKSRTVWTIIFMFILGGVQAIEPFMSPELFIFVNAGLSMIATYFKLNPSQKYQRTASVRQGHIMSIRPIIIIVLAVMLILIGVFMGAKTSTALAPDQMLGVYNGWFQAKDDKLFQAIAVCESQNNPEAKNPYSSATGRFQIIDSTWEWFGQKYWGDEFVKKDRKDWEDNSELAWALYDYGRGVSHWECYTENMI